MRTIAVLLAVVLAALLWYLDPLWGERIVPLVIVVSFMLLISFESSVDLVPQASMTPTSTKKSELKMLVDPDVPTLKEYSRGTGRGILPFCSTVDGQQRLCLAQVKPDALPIIINVEGHSCHLRWKNHRLAISKLLEKQQTS